MSLKGAVCVSLVLCGTWVAAADRWETQSDNSASTINELQPGLAQEGHDLEATALGSDQDWYRIRSRARRSYEARVFGGGIVWFGDCNTCAHLHRVDANGNILGFTDSDSLGPASISLRWIGDGNPVQYLRVTSGPDTPGVAAEKYDIRVVDTTLFLPRFNNKGTQRTVLILQNVSPVLGAGGEIVFHDESSGAPLFTRLFTTIPYGTFVLDTSSIAELAGRSGSAIILHAGGEAALVGKAVAMDPVTGFTFDTPLTGVPR